MSDRARILAAGDQGIVVELGDTIDPAINARVRRLARAVSEQLRGEVTDVVPTYRSLLVLHDPIRVPRQRLVESIERLLSTAAADTAADAPGRLVHLPARYGGEHGPDLDAVARHRGIAPDEVIALHSGATYLVYMLGFTPGFAYLGGLPDQLETPRLETPRPRVSPGSIGIAGPQTGIYPIESPGGWRIIARTPVRMFDPAAASPFLLAPGDRLRFEPITAAAFDEIGSRVASGTYQPRIVPEGGA